MDAVAASPPRRLAAQLDTLPAHLVFLLVPFYSSDPRSLGVAASQAVFVVVALYLLWRRRWPSLAGWEWMLAALGLFMLVLPGLCAWSTAQDPLLATTRIRAWAAWTLLAAVAALSRRHGRFWLPLFWLPALLAIVVYRTYPEAAWWGSGSPTTARLILAPSLALALHTGLLGRSAWLVPLRVALALVFACYFLVFAGSAELFAFLAVYLFVSAHRLWSAPYAVFFLVWWALATPHLWLDQEEAWVPPLSRVHAALVAKAPQLVLPALPSYGWEALTTAKAALPFGAGPGHESALLSGPYLSPHAYALPGAFVWEGLCALGYGFFLALAGFLLLQMVGDQADSDDPTAPRARAMLVGLWVLSFFVPFSGFLSNPLWWLSLGVLFSARPLAAADARSRRIAGHAAAIALFFLCAIPLGQQLAAARIFPNPGNVAATTAGDAGRLRRALAWEPQNGAYSFALAHAVFNANLAGRELHAEAASDEVLSLLSDAVRKEPYNGDYRWVYSRFLLLAGRWDEALTQQRRAIALAPGRLEYRRSMAETCENLGRLELALAEYRACADLSPFDPELRLSIARVLVGLKHPDAARAEYEKVLRLSPHDPIAQSFLSRMPRPRIPEVF